MHDTSVGREKKQPFPSVWRTRLILAAFVCLYWFLAVSSNRQYSATYDEPIHLVGGYAALKTADYRFFIDHPPLLPMWMALPLALNSDVKLETRRLSWQRGDVFTICWEFLNQDNDPERLLTRARFMIVLLGIGMGLVVFFWARALYGLTTAAVLLALYGLEPNVLAHTSLATTDVGVTFLIIAALYMLHRVLRGLTFANIAGLCLAFGLAQASKYTALLLGPMVMIVLAYFSLGPEPWPCPWARSRAIIDRGKKLLVSSGLLVLIIAASMAVIWSAYRFSYEPTGAGPGLQSTTDELKPSVDETALASKICAWLDKHRLLPHKYLIGFSLAMMRDKTVHTYFNGVNRTESLWYFYPAVFALKTPTAFLILFILSARVFFSNSVVSKTDRIVILVPLAIYVMALMASSQNTGVRHMLLVYPLMILMAGSLVRRWLHDRRWAVPAVLSALLLTEFLIIYPDYLASFNLLAGGPARGSRWLVDSNLDWGQDLKRLKSWMDNEGVQEVNLGYYGLADPDYYGIKYTRIAGSTRLPWESPRLPGYLAVSMTLLMGIKSGEDVHEFYRPLRDAKPVAVIGRSMPVYWLPSAP